MSRPQPKIIEPSLAREAIERLDELITANRAWVSPKADLELLKTFVDQVESRVDKDDVFVLRRIDRAHGDFAQKSPERCEALYGRGLLRRESRVYSTKKAGAVVDRRWFYALTDRGREALKAYECRTTGRGTGVAA